MKTHSMLGPRVPGEPAPVVVNPKEAAGSLKPATWSVTPRWVMLLLGRVMTTGAAKYGAFNYRKSRIAASTYQDAIERHLQSWFDGEDNDPETLESHLVSVMAGCTLLLDAQATGQLHDDREKTGLVRITLDRLEQRLKAEKLGKDQSSSDAEIAWDNLHSGQPWASLSEEHKTNLTALFYLGVQRPRVWTVPPESATG